MPFWSDIAGNSFHQVDWDYPFGPAQVIDFLAASFWRSECLPGSESEVRL